MGVTQRRKAVIVSTATLVAAVVVTSTTSAEAATFTWLNKKATANTIYTEGTVHQSRTGQTGAFNELTGIGQAQIQIWFGSYTTSAWAVKVSINGPRSYNKGKFRWNAPGAGSDQLSSKAWALNVGSLGVAPESSGAGSSKSESESVPDPLAKLASGFGLSATDLDYRARDGATTIWTARTAENSYLFTVGNDGYASGAQTTNDRLAADALSLKTAHQEAPGKVVRGQYVLVDARAEAKAKAAASQNGLRQVAKGVFVDTAAQTRAADATVDLALSDKTGGKYSIQLSRANDAR